MITKGQVLRPLCICLWLAGCSSPAVVEQDQSPGGAPSTGPSSSPAESAEGNPQVALWDSEGVPSGFRDVWNRAVAATDEGSFSSYTYTYAVSGDRAAAVFAPRPLPRDDAILVGAIVDLSKRTFGADLSAAVPRLAATPHGNAIVFTTAQTDYYVLPIKNETREGRYGAGEPHTLFLWHERR